MDVVHVPKLHSPLVRVRFDDDVELLVGSELDLRMTSWPLQVGVPHQRMARFQSFLDSVDDETSFMSTTPDSPRHVNDRLDDPPIMEDPLLVQQAEPDMIEMDMEVDMAVLLDVEFHSARVLTIPDVVRKARKIIEPISRDQLLEHLGLSAYRRITRQPCLIWQNNDLVPLSQNVLQLDDGDYVRIVLPPGHRGVDHISTRCLATAYHRGMTLDDVLAQHTMHLLGWSDHVVQPPWVPLLAEEPDDARLIQLAKYKMPSLPDIPTFQRQHQCRILGQDLDTMPMDKVETEIEFPPPPEQEMQPPLDNDIRTQPFAIQFMYDWWIQVLGHLAEQAPTRLVISTWFLDHPRHTRCEAARDIALHHDFTTWMEQIVETWNDLIDPIWPVNLHIVQPPAPVTRDRAVEQMQILVVQRSMIDQSANLFTILDNALAGYRTDVATFCSGPHPQGGCH